MTSHPTRAIEEMLERDYSVTSIRRTTGVSIPRILAVEAAWLARGDHRG